MSTGGVSEKASIPIRFYRLLSQTHTPIASLAPLRFNFRISVHLRINPFPAPHQTAGMREYSILPEAYKNLCEADLPPLVETINPGEASVILPVESITMSVEWTNWSVEKIFLSEENADLTVENKILTVEYQFHGVEWKFPTKSGFEPMEGNWEGSHPQIPQKHADS